MQPQQDVKRETYIALRARREAFRVATDFLYRDTPHEAEAVPPSPRRGKRRKRSAHCWIRAGAIALLTVMALTFVLCLMLLQGEGRVQIPRLR